MAATEHMEGRVLGGEVRGLMGLDHMGPGGDFAFTLREREPLMSSCTSGCSQAPFGCVWDTDCGGQGRRLLLWYRWEVKWTTRGKKCSALMGAVRERQGAGPTPKARPRTIERQW